MSAVSLWSMLKEHPYVWRRVAFFTLPIVAACSAEPVTPPRAPVAVVDLGPQRRLVDPEITTADSYFTSDVTLDVSMTIDSTEAFPDPATLQNVMSWTYTAPTSTFYVEGGHDVYGRTRLNTQVISDPDNENSPDAHVTYLKMIDDASSDFFAAGTSVIPPARVDAPMQSLGSLRYINFDGVAGSTPGTGGGCGTQIECLRAPETDRTLLPDGGLQVRTIYLLKPHLSQFGWRASNAKSQPTKVRETRKYEQQSDGIWLLREQIVDVEQDDGGAIIRSHKRMRLTNTKYHIDKKKDAERDRRRRSLTALPLEPSPNVASVMMPTDTGSYTTGGGGAGPVIPSCSPGSTDLQTYTGVQNIVLQHGIFSDQCTWRYMRGWISNEFSVHDMLEPSLPSLNGLADQANQLRSAITNSMPGDNGILVIGHSQGGLIARRARRDDPTHIAGVLTIGTPHTGAPLANVLQRLSFTGTVVRVMDRLNPMYRLGLDFGSFRTNLLELALCSTVGAGCDLRVGSAFINDVNSAAEDFPRAAVVARAKRTWVFYRLLGDWTCDAVQVGDDNCGRHAVRRADDVEKKLKSCAMWGGILSTVLFGAGPAAAECVVAIGYLRGADYAWRLLVSSDAVSDGFVPSARMLYPGAPAQQQYYVENSDSHVGETRSYDRVFSQVRTAMQIVFDVPAK